LIGVVHHACISRFWIVDVISFVDQLVETILDTGWTRTPPPVKPGFYYTVPDDKWQTKLMGGHGARLNIYLYEVRENRDFRRSDWDAVRLPEGTIVPSHPPVYFDCHYIISAWSPIEDTEAVSPISDEHAMLGEALRIILRNPDVNPAAFGITGGGVTFGQAHVYLALAPPEGPRVLNDFWSTMKVPWRLAVQLIVTAPLDPLWEGVPALPLAALVQRYGQIHASGIGDQMLIGIDEQVLIGGLVLDRLTHAPLVNATVRRLQAPGGAALAEIATDSQGRFAFSGLGSGPLYLHVEATGRPSIDRTLAVPAGALADHIFEV
jgi:hypothetical protein